MRSRIVVAAFLCMALPAFTQARKSCEELKSEIAKKMDEKGVKSYTLEIVDKDKGGEGKVVGTCDGGTKQIIYNKAAVSKPAAKPDSSKPKP